MLDSDCYKYLRLPRSDHGLGAVGRRRAHCLPLVPLRLGVSLGRRLGDCLVPGAVRAAGPLAPHRRGPGGRGGLALLVAEVLPRVQLRLRTPVHFVRLDLQTQTLLNG